jgi:hypothetical protein
MRVTVIPEGISVLHASLEKHATAVAMAFFFFGIARRDGHQSRSH